MLRKTIDEEDADRGTRNCLELCFDTNTGIAGMSVPNDVVSALPPLAPITSAGFQPLL